MLTRARLLPATCGLLLAAVGAVLPGVAAGAPATGDEPAPVSTLRLVLDAGAPALEAQVGQQVAPPGEVLVQADGDRAAVTLPASLPARYDGVVDPGSTLFQLPGAATPGLPSLGWTAEALPDGSVAELDLQVDGPGRLLAITDHGEGVAVEVHVDSSAPEPATIVLPVGGTTSPTWLLDQPGAYTLSATPRVRTADGTTLEGATASYLLEVSAPTPTPTTPVPAPTPTPAPAPAAPVTPTPSAERCTLPGLAGDAVTAATGHYDFGVQVDGRTLRSRVKDDQTSPATWRGPAGVLFLLGDTARTSVPDGDDYAFLGAPGDRIWSIGQTQQDGVPWLGWNTQHPSAVESIDGPTSWTLDAVDGPGELFVYQTGSFGALTRVLGTGAGWPRTLRIPANVHGHGTWSFTEPGGYRITTTHAATLRSGQRVSSTATLYVQVGPCAGADPRPQSPLAAGVLLSGDALTATPRRGVAVEPRRTTAGATVTLDVPGREPGSWLMPVVSSIPRQLGWRSVPATGRLTEAVTLPATLRPGRHHLAVYDAAGAVRGWAPVVVTREREPDDDTTAPPVPEETPAPTPAPTTPAATPTTSPALGGTAAREAPTCVPAPPAGSPASTPSGQPSAPASAAMPVTDGHLDLGAHVVGGELVPKVKDDRSQPPAWVDPASLRLVLGATAEQQVPDDPSYAFMGEPGATVWLMPQTQVAGVPWLGWNTQDESVRSQVDGPVRFTLDAVDGPGELGVYLTDSFGGIGEKTFGTAAGFPSSFDVPLNVHAHGTWVFTEPGDYAVTITQSATLASGAAVSGTATLAFTVGDAGTPRVLPRVAPAFAEPTPTPTTPSAASQADCVLPETGASRHVGLLLALGGLLVLAGAAVLVRSLRRG